MFILHTTLNNLLSTWWLLTRTVSRRASRADKKAYSEDLLTCSIVSGFVSGFTHKTCIHLNYSTLTEEH